MSGRRHVAGAPIPPEPPENAVVVAQVVYLENPGATYVYVWYRAPHGNWYVTGRQGEYPWAELWRAHEGVYVAGLYLVSDYATLDMP